MKRKEGETMNEKERGKERKKKKENERLKIVHAWIETDVHGREKQWYGFLVFFFRDILHVYTHKRERNNNGSVQRQFQERE